ncbi:glycosyltransferase [Algibacter sp. Ld11]|uniref:glycosyltransferase n=1 Tax=Algibacter sp. Ld11 TaxID=649150 RepID=UPI003869368B
MLINYIFRNKDKGGFSIEELFNSIGSILINKTDIKFYELPYSNLSIKSAISNLKFVLKKRGIIHITGDVHYVSIIPFKKTILTIHDVNSIIKGGKLSKFAKKIIWFWLPALFVKKITVISNFTKQQVLNIIPWASSKIEVVYNPVNPALKTQLKPLLNNKPVVLHLGTKNNKNLENTIKGLQDIDSKLIIVGPLSSKHIELLNICETEYANYTNVSFNKIKTLYENCDIVSFISLYEGFGMPIIEAQKVGRVVITTKMAAIPEIAQDSVHYVDPLDIQDINAAFTKIINHNQYRNLLINKGLENVKRFDINNISNQYLTIYKQLLNEY